MREARLPTQAQLDSLSAVVKPKGKLKKRGLHVFDLLRKSFSGMQFPIRGHTVQYHTRVPQYDTIVALAYYRSSDLELGEIVSRVGARSKAAITKLISGLGLCEYKWKPALKGETSMQVIEGMMHTEHLKQWRKVAKFDERRHWRDHPAEVSRSVADSYMKRYNSDPGFRVMSCLKVGMWKAMKGERRSQTLMTYIGCSIEHLREHIESQFTKGMSWDNYGEWHVDHILPKSIYDHTDEAEIYKAWNWQNLRPLWAKENHSKRDKITEPQQCLALTID